MRPLPRTPRLRALVLHRVDDSLRAAWSIASVRLAYPAAGPLAQLLDVRRLAARRTSRQLGSRRRVIYDKFDGEFASRSLTYANTGNVRYQCEVTSVIGTSGTLKDRRRTSAAGAKRTSCLLWPSRANGIPGLRRLVAKAGSVCVVPRRTTQMYMERLDPSSLPPPYH